MKLNAILKAFTCTAVLAVSLGGAVAHAQETIKVGVLLSLTGPAASFGIPERDVVKIMADKINAEGGIKGRKLELIYHDEQTNPTETARGASKLIQQDKVVAIVGPTIGSGALAMLPIAAKNEVPVLAPVGTISVTNKEHAFFPWVFRTCTNDEVLVSASLNHLIRKPGYKRLAVMYQEDAYGKNALIYAQKFAKDYGIEIVSTVGAPANAVDLSAAATKIRNANPDSVLLWTSTPGMGAAFMRSARQVDLKVPVVGSGALVQRAFVEAGGAAVEGVNIMSLVNWDDPSPKAARLGKLLRDNGKIPAGFSELLTASGMIALTEALKKIDGPVTGRAIRDALEKVCIDSNDYVQGRICYTNDSHEGFGDDALQPVVVKGGKFITVTGH